MLTGASSVLGTVHGSRPGAYALRTVASPELSILLLPPPWCLAHGRQSTSLCCLPDSTRAPHWGGARHHAIWGLPFLTLSTPEVSPLLICCFSRGKRSQSARGALLRRSRSGCWEGAGTCLGACFHPAWPSLAWGFPGAQSSQPG